jgi:hypothetical protein
MNGRGAIYPTSLAGTASPRRRAFSNLEDLAATVRRTPAFAANQRGAATQFHMPVPK